MFIILLRLFDGRANFPFTRSERSVVISNILLRVASRLAEQLKTWNLTKLGDIRKISKFIELLPST